MLLNKILVVCTGNICRSPFGEHSLQNMLPDLVVDSAGIGALVGHGADKSAQQTATLFDINLNSHVAKQINQDMCKSSDLILVMEPMHKNHICNLSPTNSGKTMLFGQWLEQSLIADPYRKDLAYFKKNFETIHKAASLWADKIKAQ